MTDLLLAPHNDDETLFGSFTILRERPMVIICLRSQVQEDRYGILASTREKETQSALWWLGQPTWKQCMTLDNDPNYADKLVDDFETLDYVHAPERVWAPHWEVGGHEQHNGVAIAASGIFGKRVQPYLTYKRGQKHSNGQIRSHGREIEYEPSWVWLKMRALCCYRSQIELDNTRPWFMDDTLREYEP